MLLVGVENNIIEISMMNGDNNDAINVRTLGAEDSYYDHYKLNDNKSYFFYFDIDQVKLFYFSQTIEKDFIFEDEKHTIFSTQSSQDSDYQVFIELLNKNFENISQAIEIEAELTYNKKNLNTHGNATPGSPLKNNIPFGKTPSPKKQPFPEYSNKGDKSDTKTTPKNTSYLEYFYSLAISVAISVFTAVATFLILMKLIALIIAALAAILAGAGFGILAHSIFSANTNNKSQDNFNKGFTV
jgi:hypothetical protein